MIDLNGKHALVTGGGSGIGRGICNVLARAGADVTVVDIDESSARKTAENLTGTGEFRFEKVDVTSGISVIDLLERVLASSSRVDILVNNAGIIGAKDWWLREEPNDDDWDAVFAVNVRGMARVTAVVSQHMIGNNYGKIVNISSVAGRRGDPTNPSYSASKAAVISLTQSTALELAPFDINVNAICPGVLWTAMWQRIAYRRSISSDNVEELLPREMFDIAIKKRMPLGREQTPEDVGCLATFLASDLACNITGQSINVDSGSYLS